MGEIKIGKEKEMTDYTFIADASLNLAKPIDNKKESGSSSPDKKDKVEREHLRRAKIAKLDKVKHKSKITGGQNKQGHSPVYE